MSQPISDELQLEGVEVYDSYLQQNVLIVAPLLLLMADNPRASELINHIGSSANYFCKICLVQDTHCINLYYYTMELMQVNKDVDPTTSGALRTSGN